MKEEEGPGAGIDALRYKRAECMKDFVRHHKSIGEDGIRRLYGNSKIYDKPCHHRLGEALPHSELDMGGQMRMRRNNLCMVAQIEF